MPAGLQVLPPWITTVCLSLLLIFVTLTLLRRGAATYRKETLRLQCSATVVLPPPRAEAEALQQPSSPQCRAAIQGGEPAASGNNEDLERSDSRPIAVDGPAAEAGVWPQGGQSKTRLSKFCGQK